MNAINLGISEQLFDYMVKTAEDTLFYRLLGISLSSIGPGYVELGVTTREEHANPLGIIHGGLLFTLADAAMGNAIRSLGILGVTVDCYTTYMSSTAFGEMITASGRVIKAGRNIIYAESRIMCGEKQLVGARGTFFKTKEI